MVARAGCKTASKVYVFKQAMLIGKVNVDLAIIIAKKWIGTSHRTEIQLQEFIGFFFFSSYNSVSPP
jgi:hypothetical protein